MVSFLELTAIVEAEVWSWLESVFGLSEVDATVGVAPWIFLALLVRRGIIRSILLMTEVCVSRD